MVKSRRDEIIFTSEGRVNTKLKRIQRLKNSTDETLLPESYVSNSTKEELCLEYIHSFIDQFTSIYPKRKSPFMIVENEFGVEKFVSATLRPTLLPISELYDFYECASFVAGYINYEPLDPPDQPPEVLPSPNVVLQEHTGDCLDIAILLCSFLLGAGYDAYVVYGYAPKSITLKDQSKSDVPLNISSSDGMSKLNKNTEEEVQGEDNPYVPIDNKVRDSSYIEKEIERKRIAGLDTFRLWVPVDNRSTESTVVDEDESRLKRVHSWVMIKAGHRNVQENMFIEPTTGRTYPITNCPYLGMESLWNSKNYWINLAFDKKFSEVSYESFIYI